MRLFIHIGMLKTGTTFIEDNLYSNHPQINFLNKIYFREIEYLIYCIRNLSNKDFEKKKNDLDKKLNSFNFEKRKINIISAVGITDVISNDSNYYDLKKILQRIKYLFGKKFDLKILFTIRDQKTYLLSRYSEAQNKFIQKNPKWNTFSGLLQFFYKKKNHLKIEKLFFKSLKYYEQTNIIEKIFKVKNCKILLYENLNYNQKSFIKEIYKFLNISFTKKFNKKLKIINQTKKFDQRYKIKAPKIKKLVIRNILDPWIFFSNFFHKVRTFYNLLFKYIVFNILTTNDNKTISLSEKDKMIISNYYKKDNILLNKKIKYYDTKYN